MTSPLNFFSSSLVSFSFALNSTMKLSVNRTMINVVFLVGLTSSSSEFCVLSESGTTSWACCNVYKLSYCINRECYSFQNFFVSASLMASHVGFKCIHVHSKKTQCILEKYVLLCLFISLDRRARVRSSPAVLCPRARHIIRIA